MARPKPNVLFVTVDQWPGALLGCAGHQTIETPTIDQLARVGTRYTQCYAQTPICIPARRSIMTGMTSRGHGDRDFQPDLPMPHGVPTLASAFGAAGYQTFAIGKLHVYPPRDRIGFDDPSWRKRVAGISADRTTTRCSSPTAVIPERSSCTG